MKNKIKEIIFDYVESKNGGVTFAELDNWLEQNQVNYQGSCYVAYNKEFNLIAWINMSRDYMEAILELENETKINVQQCSAMLYLVDGTMLNLPMPKSMHKYKEPHWLPCEINLGDKVKNGYRQN